VDKKINKLLILIANEDYADYPQFQQSIRCA